MEIPELIQIYTIPVANMLERWPKVSQIFITHRLACIGCDFSKFHTIQDVIEIYHLEEKAFMEELLNAISLLTSDPE